MITTIAYVLYMLGSLCFFVGTALCLAERMGWL